MPDHRPRILVTGSTDGIGKQTALELLQRAARVIVHGSSAEKVERTRAELVKLTGAEPEGWACDFSSLAQVREAARRLKQVYPKLDVLVNNAGLMSKERKLSHDGYELTFAVNHLAPFLLTNLLLPALDAAAPSRIVNVSSQVHRGAKLDLTDLHSERGYSGYAAYAQSKLCNLLFTQELARRLDSRKTTANALHPGVVGTRLLREGFSGYSGSESLAEGAATSVYLAVSPEVAQVTGKYFQRSREAPASFDAELARQLWDESARLTGLV